MSMKILIPNAITALRIILLPFLAAELLNNEMIAAAILLSAIIITDILDGYAARMMKAETEFGREFDRAADVLVLTTVFIFIAIKKIIPSEWLVLLVIIILAAALLESVKRLRRHEARTKKEKAEYRVYNIACRTFGAVNYAVIFAAILWPAWPGILLYLLAASILIGGVRMFVGLRI